MADFPGHLHKLDSTNMLPGTLSLSTATDFFGGPMEDKVVSQWLPGVYSSEAAIDHFGGPMEDKVVSQWLPGTNSEEAAIDHSSVILDGEAD